MTTLCYSIGACAVLIALTYAVASILHALDDHRLEQMAAKCRGSKRANVEAIRSIRVWRG